MNCKYCGAELETTAKFCRHCGKRVENDRDVEIYCVPEYYDANVYGWKYGYQYAPYELPPYQFKTHFWSNVFMLFAFSPILGFLGVLASRQAAFAYRLGWRDRAWSRAQYAELIFWVGMAVGIVWSLVISIRRFDELLELAMDSCPL